MKKTTYLMIGLIFLSFKSFSQERTAWIGLSKMKTNFTFPTTSGAVAPVCYFTEQKSFSDSLAFSALKSKVDSILTAAGLVIIPENDVTTAESFKKRVAENRKLEKGKDPLQFPPVTCPEGYGPLEGNGLGGLNYLEDYYAIPAKPEILITAEFDFDLSLSQRTPTSEKYLELKTFIYVYGYAGKKQIFKLKSVYFDPKHIQFKPNVKSCWGYDITEDIGAKQQQALNIAIGKLTEDLENTKGKMQKYREKKAK